MRSWIWFGTVCLFAAALTFLGFWRALPGQHHDWMFAVINFGFATYFAARAIGALREAKKQAQVQAWYAEVKNHARQHHWIESTIGRRRRFPEN